MQWVAVKCVSKKSDVEWWSVKPTGLMLQFITIRFTAKVKFYPVLLLHRPDDLPFLFQFSVWCYFFLFIHKIHWLMWKNKLFICKSGSIPVWTVARSIKQFQPGHLNTSVLSCPFSFWLLPITSFLLTASTILWIRSRFISPVSWTCQPKACKWISCSK